MTRAVFQVELYHRTPRATPCAVEIHRFLGQKVTLIKNPQLHTRHSRRSRFFIKPSDEQSLDHQPGCRPITGFTEHQRINDAVYG